MFSARSLKQPKQFLAEGEWMMDSFLTHETSKTRKWALRCSVSAVVLAVLSFLLSTFIAAFYEGGPIILIFLAMFFISLVLSFIFASVGLFKGIVFMRKEKKKDYKILLAIIVDMLIFTFFSATLLLFMLTGGLSMIQMFIFGFFVFTLLLLILGWALSGTHERV